ncbi:hypothetical protein MIR68_006832 [Amoeboaphelidium protococcarum]|nr:hypothetical protein MIR68_006832 [Amoeboaphelidium protococcarum]
MDREMEPVEKSQAINMPVKKSANPQSYGESIGLCSISGRNVDRFSAFEEYNGFSQLRRWSLSRKSNMTNGGDSQSASSPRAFRFSGESVLSQSASAIQQLSLASLSVGSSFSDYFARHTAAAPLSSSLRSQHSNNTPGASSLKTSYFSCGSLSEHESDGALLAQFITSPQSERKSKSDPSLTQLQVINNKKADTLVWDPRTNSPFAVLCRSPRQ